MPPQQRSTARRRVALAGLLGGAVIVAVAELLSLAFSSASAPFVAVGGAFIDVLPPPVTELAISLFGTYDRAVLFVSMGIVYAVLTAAIGLLGQRSRAGAGALLTGLGLFATVMVLSRTGTLWADAVPTLAGTVAGVGAQQGLLALAAREAASEQGRPPRRRFLAAAVATAGVAGAGGLIGRAVGSSRAPTEDTQFALPEPDRPAAGISPDAQVDIDGMPPYLTPADDFYRIDTALVVPRVDPGSWSLRITGLVEQELTLDIGELLAEPMVEATLTLTCVSNPVGGDLAGNATWLGVPVRTLLERAGIREGADMVLSRSVDGFTASTPLEALTDERNSLLAVAMNGQPLPRQHGYPVRMVVPGLYGYVSATKWVEELKVTRFADDTAYWTDRGWSERGPIKIASRVDVPRPRAEVEAGTVGIGGTAWAQQRGISQVEVSIDDGEWREAELGGEVNDDTWRQWSFTWEGAEPGDHTVTVRAVDGTGEMQTADRADPVPNGASGWHTQQFRVA